jgi:hypothetical protein
MVTQIDDSFSHLAQPDELTRDVFPRLGQHIGGILLSISTHSSESAVSTRIRLYSDDAS